jgi:nucleoside-diphosphate-sugar epimerase
MTSQRPLHVVFAPDPIGLEVAARLAAAGRRVRLARRSGVDLGVPGVETVAVDGCDGSAVRAAVRGAEAVYHCLRGACSPRAWEEVLPRLHANLLDAAGRAGARLVVLDDLSAYGRTGGTPIAEDTAPNPTTRRGALRAKLVEDVAAAACRGDVRAVVGRASDLFGPAVWAKSPLGEAFWRPIVGGRMGAVPGNPDVVHAWHFASDVAAALVTLGVDEASDGLWMLPCAPAVSTRALVGRMAAALGREIPLQRAGRVGRLGMAVPLGHAPGDDAGRWDEPCLVDHRRFRERYGEGATPLDRAARLTVDDALSRLLSPAPLAVATT